MSGLLFATPEQKVIRFLLSEPTTSFSVRVIASKLKGVRGLGGSEGILKILHELQAVGLVDFLDNHRAVRLQDDNPTAHVLKVVAAIADLEGLRELLMPISSRVILFGSRAAGKGRSDSDFDLFIVSDSPEEVKRVVAGYPLGKPIEPVVWKSDAYQELERDDPGLAEKIMNGVVIWGPGW